MLLEWKEFGGIVPRIADPRLIPQGKGQLAKNCRFNRGGVMPLGVNEATVYPGFAGSSYITIYLYQEAFWFSWNTQADPVLTPLSNDSFKRVYFTEAGVLKVTDYNKATIGGRNGGTGSRARQTASGIGGGELRPSERTSQRTNLHGNFPRAARRAGSGPRHGVPRHLQRGKRPQDAATPDCDRGGFPSLSLRWSHS